MSYSRDTIASLFDQRQSRKVHPDGSFDKQGRWYPSALERQPCCDAVRQPTRAYPYSLMVHCRTRKHIKALVTGGVTQGSVEWFRDQSYTALHEANLNLTKGENDHATDNSAK